MARTLRAKIQTFIIMKMNRCLVLVLPLLFVMSSCGTTAQFAQQRFQDGIYSRPEPVAEAVQIYSKDDFAAMAAANIAREDNQKDTVYVVVRDEYSWYDSPWFAWGSAWAFSWPYRYWWNDPWYYGWGPYWRSPWYYSWYWDPWYYDPWFRDPWYYGSWYWHPHYHYRHDYHHWRRPGLSADGRHYYGPRFLTQGGGSRVSVPGSSGFSGSSGSARSYTRSYTTSGSSFGSSGNRTYRRGSSSGTSGRGTILNSSGSGGSSTGNTSRRPNSNYNYSRGWSSGSNSSGSYNRGSSSPSRSYTAPSGGASSRPSYSAPSRSYGGGGGGGMRSGGSSYSRGRR